MRTLTLLHSKGSKLYGVLAVLSAQGLRADPSLRREAKMRVASPESVSIYLTDNFEKFLALLHEKQEGLKALNRSPD